MKRGGLFFIGLLSAVITVVSLNAVLGNNYNNNYRGYHHCYWNDRYKNDRSNNQRMNEQQQDSSSHNY